MSSDDQGSSNRGDRNSAGDGDGKSREPNPAVIGPTDVGEEVRADLEAAFAVDSTRLRIKDDARIGASRVATGDPTKDLTGAATGVFTYPESEFAESQSVGDSANQTEQTSQSSDKGQRKSVFGKRKRRRRSILEIAHEYDTRIKEQSEAAKAAALGQNNVQDGVSSTSPATIDDDQEVIEVEPADVEGKKRVVITDDTIDVDPKSSSRYRSPRQRKKRLWSRSRTEQDDELSRLRKQRRASQRIDRRWRPRWYTVVAAVAVLVVGALLLLTSPLLSIKRIDVEGNVYADPTLLAAVIENLSGDPILTADLHGAEVQIEAIPWVRKARVSMHLPSRIVIQLDERSPLAFVRSVDGFIRVLDRDGRVLDVIEGDPVDFIRIIGTAPTLVGGDFVPQPFLGTVQLINALPRDLADRLISATVSPEGEISLQFKPNLQVIFGNPADYQAKLVGVINEIKRQGTKSYTVIDVSSGDPNVR